MTPQELRDRLARFARDVAVFARPLLDSPATRDIALQLMRSSASAAANHRAAGRARSHREFTSRIGVALEEGDESLFWFEHLRDGAFVPAASVQQLLKEADELVAILARSHTTARSRHRRAR